MYKGIPDRARAMPMTLKKLLDKNPKEKFESLHMQYITLLRDIFKVLVMSLICSEIQNWEDY